jgi:dihydrofolate reductase
MGELVLFESVSLDGVMQAPGRADEDTRDGFAHGGWAGPYADADQGRMAGESMATTEALLFGRRTYEDFHAVWPHRVGNPFTEVLNNSPKYVASRTLAEPLPWQNSTLLAGDAMVAVADLKRRLAKNIVVLGSGDLARSLLAAGLVDHIVLMIHPLTLGRGRRLFAADGSLTRFALAATSTSSIGVIMASYRPAQARRNAG